MTDTELADWILENRSSPIGYPDGSVNWRLVLRDDKIDRIVAALRDNERLRGLLIDANNQWRHEFSAEVEAAAEKLFKRLSANSTDPFGRKTVHTTDAA